MASRPICVSSHNFSKISRHEYTFAGDSNATVYTAVKIRELPSRARHNGPISPEWAHMVHLTELFFSFVGNMWSQCVSAPSEEVCTGLRVCNLRRRHPPPPPRRPLAHFLRVSGTTTLPQRRDICASRGDRATIPSLISTERICRASTAFDERRNFSAGTDNMFRKNIGDFARTPEINSPCFERRSGFHFFSTSEN